MSSTKVSSSPGEDASSEGSDARSVPCSLIDSSYSIVGSLIVDKNETVEEPPRETEELEDDDGVDVIEEESVSENQGLLKGVQDLLGADSGIHPEIYQGTEDQPSTALIAETGGLGKSSPSSDMLINYPNANKVRLLKRVAQAPFDLRMNLVIFILITILLAGYMQYRIDYKNEVLSQKIESMNSQLQRLQRSGSAAMSAYIKNQIELRHNLCPVFVEILQVVEFFVQTESPSGVIDACGKVIQECLRYKTVNIGLFLESDGLCLLESISAQQQKMDHWIVVLRMLFSRWNTVHCTQKYVEQLLELLDPAIHREVLAQLAGGILCKCLDHEDVWDSNTEPTKKQVSEAVSKAIETWKVNYMHFDHIPEAVTWVKKSSETAQQHFAARSLFVMTDMESSVKQRIRNVIEEVILEEILKDPRPHPHTKALIQQFLDK